MRMKIAALLRIPAFLWFLLLTLSFCLPLRAEIPWAENRSRGEDLSIRLVTFGPGEEITTFFGHTGIIVEDRKHNISRLYNFGLFSIEKNFVYNFAQGRLIFWAGDGRVGPSILRYVREDRDVFIQNLNLPPEKRLAVAEQLAWWVLPENSSYLYHHYTNNCATIPRDILNEAVDGALRHFTNVPSEMTYRDFTKRYTVRQPALMILLMFLMNDSIDKSITKWEDMFLPLELKENVADLMLTDSTGAVYPFVESEIQHYESSKTPPPDEVPSFFGVMLILGLVSGGAALLLGKVVLRKRKVYKVLFGLYNMLFGLLLGIPGLALFLMSLFTDHVVTYYNENLFLANPVTFFAGILAVIRIFRKKPESRWLFYFWFFLFACSMVLLLLKFLPFFDQANGSLIAFILPVNAGFALAHYLITFRTGIPKA